MNWKSGFQLSSISKKKENKQTKSLTKWRKKVQNETQSRWSKNSNQNASIKFAPRVTCVEDKGNGKNLSSWDQNELFPYVIHASSTHKEREETGLAKVHHLHRVFILQSLPENQARKILFWQILHVGEVWLVDPSLRTASSRTCSLR